MVRLHKIKGWILPFILIVALVAFVAAAVSYRPSPTPQKLEAAKYFAIANATPSSFDYELFRDSNGTYLKIYALQFTIKAVGGPAHEVIVLGLGGGEPYDVGDIKQGQTGFASLQIPHLGGGGGYLITKDENGEFLVTIEIVSQEAEGEITFPI